MATSTQQMTCELVATTHQFQAFSGDRRVLLAPGFTPWDPPKGGQISRSGFS